MGRLFSQSSVEKETVKLEDILSHDSTFIDEFIRRKFEESGKDFFGSRKDLSVFVNPPDDFVLGGRTGNCGGFQGKTR